MTNLRLSLLFIVIYAIIGYWSIQAASLALSRAWNVVGDKVAEVAK